MLSSIVLACGNKAETAVPLVITAVPWSNGEEAHYTLEDSKGNTVATALLSIQRDGDAFLLTQYFETPTSKDRLETRVQLADLHPIATERMVTGKDGDLRIQAQYKGDSLAMSWTTAEDLRSRQTEVSPDVYDNASALFLWRTVPFEEGFETFYHSLNTSQVRVPEKVTVRLRVAGKETVEVPAGSFTAWKVVVDAAGERHVAWYAVDGAHPLVKYDNNGKQLFLLEELTSQPQSRP